MLQNHLINVAVTPISGELHLLCGTVTLIMWGSHTYYVGQSHLLCGVVTLGSSVYLSSSSMKFLSLRNINTIVKAIYK